LIRHYPVCKGERINDMTEYRVLRVKLMDNGGFGILNVNGQVVGRIPMFGKSNLPSLHEYLEAASAEGFEVVSVGGDTNNAMVILKR
jgi:hypothetical protein